MKRLPVKYENTVTGQISKDLETASLCLKVKKKHTCHLAPLKLINKHVI